MKRNPVSSVGAPAPPWVDPGLTGRTARRSVAARLAACEEMHADHAGVANSLREEGWDE